MHAGKNYTFKEVIFWTKRDIVSLLTISAVPTVCYKLLGWTWLAVPWLPIALIGTAVAFIVGFKNNASYDRMWEARKIWGAIVNASRSWGMMVKDFISEGASPESNANIKAAQRKMMNRHFAWLAAMRFNLREPRTWEAIYKPHNADYRNKWFTVDEQTGDLRSALRHYLDADELEVVMSKSNKATHILSLQSAHLKQLFENGSIDSFHHIELERLLVELYSQQGASERIKNFPYPRQYATVNLYFVKIFIFLLPLGMLEEFDKLNEHLFWLTIPFSALCSWIFTTMEKIGESTESPFEGSANDVPITAISRTIEIDLKEMFGMENSPEPLKPQNNILM